jgi:hypothetical protein
VAGDGFNGILLAQPLIEIGDGGGASYDKPSSPSWRTGEQSHNASHNATQARHNNDPMSVHRSMISPRSRRTDICTRFETKITTLLKQALTLPYVGSLQSHHYRLTTSIVMLHIKDISPCAN